MTSHSMDFFHYGSEGEKIFHRTVEAFARDYIDSIAKDNSKWALSIGWIFFWGLVAFEMAVQLQKAGFDVPVLILIDCKVPII